MVVQRTKRENIEEFKDVKWGLIYIKVRRRDWQYPKRWWLRIFLISGRHIIRTRNFDECWASHFSTPQTSRVDNMQNSKDEKILNTTRMESQIYQVQQWDGTSLLNSNDKGQRILQCWWKKIVNLEWHIQLDNYSRFRVKWRVFHIKTEFTTSRLSLKELLEEKGKQSEGRNEMQERTEFWVRKLANIWVNLNKPELY